MTKAEQNSTGDCINTQALEEARPPHLSSHWALNTHLQPLFMSNFIHICVHVLMWKLFITQTGQWPIDILYIHMDKLELYFQMTHPSFEDINVHSIVNWLLSSFKLWVYNGTCIQIILFISLHWLPLREKIWKYSATLFMCMHTPTQLIFFLYIFSRKTFLYLSSCPYNPCCVVLNMRWLSYLKKQQ